MAVKWVLYMKFRTKVITGISIALVIILIFIVVDQRWIADLKDSKLQTILYSNRNLLIQLLIKIRKKM